MLASRYAGKSGSLRCDQVKGRDRLTLFPGRLTGIALWQEPRDGTWVSDSRSSIILAPLEGTPELVEAN